MAIAFPGVALGDFQLFCNGAQLRLQHALHWQRMQQRHPNCSEHTVYSETGPGLESAKDIPLERRAWTVGNERTAMATVTTTATNTTFTTAATTTAIHDGIESFFGRRSTILVSKVQDTQLERIITVNQQAFGYPFHIFT